MAKKKNISVETESIIELNQDLAEISKKVEALEETVDNLWQITEQIYLDKED